MAQLSIRLASLNHVVPKWRMQSTSGETEGDIEAFRRCVTSPLDATLCTVGTRVGERARERQKIKEQILSEA